MYDTTLRRNLDVAEPTKLKQACKAGVDVVLRESYHGIDFRQCFWRWSARVGHVIFPASPFCLVRRLSHAENDPRRGAKLIPGFTAKKLLLIQLLRLAASAEVPVHYTARAVGAVERSTVPCMAVHNDDVSWKAENKDLIHMRRGPSL